MADVDTSSYPRAQAPTNPLDTIGKITGIQQQNLALQQGRLALAHQQSQILNQQLGALANDPNTKPEDVMNTIDNGVKLGYISPQQAQLWKPQIPTDPAQLQALLKKQALSWQSSHDQLSATIGAPGYVNNGQSLIPVNHGINGVQQTGQGIGIYPSRSELTQPRTLTGANGQTLQLPQAGVNALQGSSAVNRAPTQIAPMAPGAQPPSAAPVATQGAQGMPPAAQGDVGTVGIPAPPATFDADKTAYTNDLAKVPAVRQSIVPLREALSLARQLAANPTIGYRTPAYNNFLAAATNAGVVKADPGSTAALTAEMNKYLAQGISAAGGERSDMDLAAKQAANPNSTQVDPALMSLTKKTIGQRLMSTYAPQTFDSSTGNGVNGYQKHAADFGTKQNLDAYTIADSTPEERAAIMQKYMKNGKKDTSNPEAVKFFDSMKTLIKHGDLSIPGAQ